MLQISQLAFECGVFGLWSFAGTASAITWLSCLLLVRRRSVEALRYHHLLKISDGQVDCLLLRCASLFVRASGLLLASRALLGRGSPPWQACLLWRTAGALARLSAVQLQALLDGRHLEAQEWSRLSHLLLQWSRHELGGLWLPFVGLELPFSVFSEVAQVLELG